VKSAQHLRSRRLRHNLFSLVGEETLSLLPPTMEALILAIKKEVQVMVDAVSAEVETERQLRTKLKSELDDLRETLKADVASELQGLRGELKDEHAAELQALRAELRSEQSDLHALREELQAEIEATKPVVSHHCQFVQLSSRFTQADSRRSQLDDWARWHQEREATLFEDGDGGSTTPDCLQLTIANHEAELAKLKKSMSSVIIELANAEAQFGSDSSPFKKCPELAELTKLNKSMASVIIELASVEAHLKILPPPFVQSPGQGSFRDPHSPSHSHRRRSGSESTNSQISASPNSATQVGNSPAGEFAGGLQGSSTAASSSSSSSADLDPTDVTAASLSEALQSSPLGSNTCKGGSNNNINNSNSNSDSINLDVNLNSKGLPFHEAKSVHFESPEPESTLSSTTTGCPWAGPAQAPAAEG